MSPTWLLSLQLASLKAPTQVLPSGLGTTRHASMCEFAERSMGYDVPAGHDVNSMQILACDWEHLLAAGAVTCYSTPLRVPLCQVQLNQMRRGPELAAACIEVFKLSGSIQPLCAGPEYLTQEEYLRQEGIKVQDPVHSDGSFHG